MTFRSGMSIRTKILLLLTLVPLVTLGLFLILAMNIFESDKIAYVFESSAAVSKTLSAQVGTELNATLMTAKPMMQEFISQKQFGAVSKSIFEADAMIDSIAVVKVEADKPFLLAQVEKTEGDVQALVSSQNTGKLLQETTLASGRLVRMPFQDDRVLIIEKVNTPQGDFFFLITARLKEVALSFRSPSSGQNYLVSQKGLVLLGFDGAEGQDLSEKMDLQLTARMADQKFSMGTDELKTSQGDSWLASFTKVGFADLFVVSLVPKKEALRAVQVLLRKSVIFFMLLLSGTTIVSLFASGTLTQSLTSLFEATKKVAEGHFEIRVKVKSNDEVGSLAQSFNAMAEEVSRLMMETAEKARMEGELKTAQTVQETLFPASNADLNGFRVSGHYEPASECGGDWWHYCKVGNKIYLWIGDATGHGAPAALITSAAKSAATIIETLKVSPGEALKLLNQSVFEVSKGRIMMTFFLGCFDQETKVFTYANASHEAPYLIKVQEEALKKKNLIPLNEVTSPRLGQARDTVYEECSLTLDPGDRIFFYTDGLPDIQNPAKEGWGEREFIKGILSTNQGYPPIQDSVQNLVTLFSDYRQGTPLIDDITFFMTQFEKEPS
jgi:sigma-B regulation protein RsbU (phosphoserine phosphatase)